MNTSCEYDYINTVYIFRALECMYLHQLTNSPNIGKYVELSAYSTTTSEYYFYFPATGTFPHFPVHVSKNEKV